MDDMSHKFTKNRKVELLDTGGHSLTPPVTLAPLTEVEVTSSDASTQTLALQGISYVRVRVISFPNTGKEGCIPFAALDDLALSTFAFGRGRTSFTGFSYGADVLLWDGE